MLIRLVLTEIQPFENAKIYKEIYGHPDAVSDSVRMPYFSFSGAQVMGSWLLSLLILTFFNRCISVKTSLINNELSDFVNPSVLILTQCASIGAYTIIYRLVPSPSRFEIRQWRI